MAKNNTVSFNGSHGLTGNLYSIMENNISNDNVGNGIEAGFGTIVKGNTISDNMHGVWCIESKVYQNTIMYNDLDGIFAFAGCNLKENSIRGNRGFGINASSNITIVSQLEKNVLVGNISGTINGTRYFLLDTNFCETDDVCP